MKPILVTGGAGYIGSHVCKALALAGYLPVAFDSLEMGHEWAVRWGPLERGNILDRARLDAAFAAHRPHAVVHCAAYAYVAESVADPGRYIRNNVAGTLTLLEAMRDNGVPDLVFSSSCATYGEPQTVPIPESAPQNPVNPYGRSKLMSEQMFPAFAAVHGLRWASLRYFNAAGADPQGEIGEEHDPEISDLIARIQTLTPQQTRVLSMLAEGLLNKQIAYELNVSEATIKAHVSAVLQKLGVDSRTQAVIRLSRIGTEPFSVNG